MRSVLTFSYALIFKHLEIGYICIINDILSFRLNLLQYAHTYFYPILCVMTMLMVIPTYILCLSFYLITPGVSLKVKQLQLLSYTPTQVKLFNPVPQNQSLVSSRRTLLCAFLLLADSFNIRNKQ